MNEMFQCEFNTPMLISKEQNLQEILVALYLENIVPILISHKHSTIDSMNKSYPAANFVTVVFSVKYLIPFRT